MKKKLDITGNPRTKFPSRLGPSLYPGSAVLLDGPGLQEIRYTTFQSWVAILKTDKSTIETFTIIL